MGEGFDRPPLTHSVNKKAEVGMVYSDIHSSIDVSWPNRPGQYVRGPIRKEEVVPRNLQMLLERFRKNNADIAGKTRGDRR
jgi:hypothetical protein